MSSFDYVILGGGCIGSSIAFQLAAEGISNVALLDNHSSRKHSATLLSGGMIRAFHENLCHTKLAHNSNLRFRKWIDDKIIKGPANVSGSLYFFDPVRRKEYEKSLNYLLQNNYPLEVLTSEQGQERFPEFNWKQRWAIFEPQGMQISPVEYVDEMLKGARAQGVSIFPEHEVLKICQFHGGYRLIGKELNILAKTLILAGGASMMGLIQDLKLGLSLEAKMLKYFKVQSAGRKKILPNYFDRETLEFGGGFLSENIILSELKPTRIQEKFDVSNYEICEALDSYSPQRQGYIGFVSGFSNLLIATGWGGTAFKFAPEVAAQIALLLKQTNEGRRISYG